MREKRFQRVNRAYDRSQEKARFQDILEDYFDPEIQADGVGGGDPGIAMLMAAGDEEVEVGYTNGVRPAAVGAGGPRPYKEVAEAVPAEVAGTASPPPGPAAAPRGGALGNMMRRIYARVQAAVSPH